MEDGNFYESCTVNCIFLNQLLHERRRGQKLVWNKRIGFAKVFVVSLQYKIIRMNNRGGQFQHGITQGDPKIVVLSLGSFPKASNVFGKIISFSIRNIETLLITRRYPKMLKVKHFFSNRIVIWSATFFLSFLCTFKYLQRSDPENFLRWQLQFYSSVSLISNF